MAEQRDERQDASKSVEPIAMREQGWVPMFHYQAIRLADLAAARAEHEADVAQTAASIAATYTRIQEQIDALRKRVDEALKDRDERTALALSARDDAIKSARLSLEERLKLLNEFRAQSQDEARKFAMREYVDSMLADLARQTAGAVPREAYEARCTAIEKSLSANTERLQRIEGGAAGSARTLTVVLAIGSFLAAASVVAITLFMSGG